MKQEEAKRGGIGKIVQIIGAVVDVRFEKHELPRLLSVTTTGSVLCWRSHSISVTISSAALP